MHEVFRILRARIKAFWRRRDMERDLEDEIAFHLAEKQRELEETGTATEEAAVAAKRRFGNASLAKERSRDAGFSAVSKTWYATENTPYGYSKRRVRSA
jgi:hypothetical protein